MSDLKSNTTNTIKFQKDQILFKKGDNSSYVYIIAKGSVGVFVSDNKTSQLITVLNEKDFIGELALFSEAKRNATAVALEPTEVLMIKKSNILKVVKECPEWVTDIMITLSDRMRSTTLVLSDHGIVDNQNLDQREVTRLQKMVSAQS